MLRWCRDFRHSQLILVLSGFQAMGMTMMNVVVSATKPEIPVREVVKYRISSPRVAQRAICQALCHTTSTHTTAPANMWTLCMSAAVVVGIVRSAVGYSYYLYITMCKILQNARGSRTTYLKR